MASPQTKSNNTIAIGIAIGFSILLFVIGPSVWLYRKYRWWCYSHLHLTSRRNTSANMYGPRRDALRGAGGGARQDALSDTETNVEVERGGGMRRDGLVGKEVVV
jgi:hypothetical protein